MSWGVQTCPGLSCARVVGWGLRLPLRGEGGAEKGGGEKRRPFVPGHSRPRPKRTLAAVLFPTGVEAPQWRPRAGEDAGALRVLGAGVASPRGFGTFTLERKGRAGRGWPGPRHEVGVGGPPHWKGNLQPPSFSYSFKLWF